MRSSTSNVAEPVVGDYSRKLAADAAEAISSSFVWSDSDEGHDYWMRVERRLSQIANDGIVNHKAAQTNRGEHQ